MTKQQIMKIWLITFLVSRYANMACMDINNLDDLGPLSPRSSSASTQAYVRQATNRLMPLNFDLITFRALYAPDTITDAELTQFASTYLSLPNLPRVLRNRYAAIIQKVINPQPKHQCLEHSSHRRSNSAPPESWACERKAIKLYHAICPDTGKKLYRAEVREPDGSRSMNHTVIARWDAQAKEYVFMAALPGGVTLPIHKNAFPDRIIPRNIKIDRQGRAYLSTRLLP